MGDTDYSSTSTATHVNVAYNPEDLKNRKTRRKEKSVLRRSLKASRLNI